MVSGLERENVEEKRQTAQEELQVSKWIYGRGKES
jgi:hypothetical protein